METWYRLGIGHVAHLDRAPLQRPLHQRTSAPRSCGLEGQFGAGLERERPAPRKPDPALKVAVRPAVAAASKQVRAPGAGLAANLSGWPADPSRFPSRWPGRGSPKCGGPCRIRTCGLRIRSPTLYPTELRALDWLAEREGFEPSIQLWAVYWFSKPAPSASRPPLPDSCTPVAPGGGTPQEAQASRPGIPVRQGKPPPTRPLPGRPRTVQWPGRACSSAG